MQPGRRLRQLEWFRRRPRWLWRIHRQKNHSSEVRGSRRCGSRITTMQDVILFTKKANDIGGSRRKPIVEGNGGCTTKQASVSKPFVNNPIKGFPPLLNKGCQKEAPNILRVSSKTALVKGNYPPQPPSQNTSRRLACSLSSCSVFD